MTNDLQQAYSPDHFRKKGQDVIDMITQYFEDCQQKNIPTYPFAEPDAQYDFWKTELKKGEIPLTDFYKKVIQRSIHVHHPNYMGHQVAAPMPEALFSSMVSALLNNGMAIYEMGMVSTVMEKIIFEKLAKVIGYDDEMAGGIFTSGGSIANLTALLTARSIQAEEDIWENGTQRQYAVMVSEEAHYCVDRSVRMMGWGSKGIIKIPSNARFQMQTDLLESYYQKAKKDGIKILAVVGSACNTATGIYDNLEAIADFCESKKLWFHVDGAHGGAALFSKKYNHFLKGIHRADSVVIDFHKMILTPALCTAVIYKNEKTSHQTFKQKADYLFNESSDWYNTGKRTIECTKLMMCLHPFLIFKQYGTALIENFVDQSYDAARLLAKKIEAHPNFEIATPPDTNILCFRYLKEAFSEEEQNQLNQKIREKLLEEGKFYIVQTQLRGRLYLRTAIMNPMSGEKEFDNLLKYIEGIAKQL